MISPFLSSLCVSCLSLETIKTLVTLYLPCTSTFFVMVKRKYSRLLHPFKTILCKKVMLGTKFKRCVHYHELRATDCCFLGGFVQSNLSKPCAILSITFLNCLEVQGEDPPLFLLHPLLLLLLKTSTHYSRSKIVKRKIFKLKKRANNQIK